jgi:hypothetical protein
MRDPNIDGTPYGVRRGVVADRKNNAPTRALFADLDDVEQMVILLNIVLERQVKAGCGNG